MKRASLTLFLLAAALSSWLLWPRHVSGPPALERTGAQEVGPTGSGKSVEPGGVLARESPPQRLELPAEPLVLEDANEVLASPFPPGLDEDPPFGTIQGVVLRDRTRSRQPVAGARVTLHLCAGADDARLAREQTQVDGTNTWPDGSFRFAGVEPGIYTIRAVDGSFEREGRIAMTRGTGAPRVLLAFGSGRIHGTIRDLAGVPLRDCKLRLEATSTFQHASTPSTLHAIAATDADGEYSFADLAADTYELVLEVPGESSKCWPARTWYVRLAETQHLELDAGRRGGAPRWIGTVRHEDGSGLEQSCAFSLGCSEPPDAKGVIWIAIEAQTSSAGEFDVPLEPGDWTAMLPLSSRTTKVQLELCTVPACGIRHDIVLP